MANNYLYLFTSEYPYGNSETFIETEIKYLSIKFDEIIIFPYNKGNHIRILPDNVSVFEGYLDNDCKNYSTLKTLFKNFIFFINVFFCELKFVKKDWLSITSHISSTLRYIYKSNILNKVITSNKQQNVVYYSYWFVDWATILSFLKKRRKINSFVSRAHGYDLYMERNENNYIPFRQIHLQNVDKLFLISKNGLNYMKSNYPQFSNKYELSLLGVENKNLYNENILPKKHFIVISCSRVVPVKRIDLIIKSLAKVPDTPIKWIHFGDGELYSEIQMLADKLLPSKIEAEFKGMVTNEEVLQFYKNNHVDCFINLSSSEGLPVSIMEAISYGIPIIATDVGGTNEIVNKITGRLLRSNVEYVQVAEYLNDLLVNKSRDRDYRLSIYNFWKQRFCAQENYIEFTKKLKQVN